MRINHREGIKRSLSPQPLPSSPDREPGVPQERLWPAAPGGAGGTSGAPCRDRSVAERRLQGSVPATTWGRSKVHVKRGDSQARRGAWGIAGCQVGGAGGLGSRVGAPQALGTTFSTSCVCGQFAPWFLCLWRCWGRNQGLCVLSRLCHEPRPGYSCHPSYVCHAGVEPGPSMDQASALPPSHIPVLTITFK